MTVIVFLEGEGGGVVRLDYILFMHKRIFPLALFQKYLSC